MRIKFSIISIVFIMLASFFVNPAYAAGDKEKGEELSQTCLGCHGSPGFRNASPVYRVPMIGGQNAEYIVAALKAYQEKKRTHPTMQSQAANLSEQDMQDIAVYFEGLNQTTKVVKKAGAQAGKKIAEQICAGCHGIDGNTNEASKKSGYPNLAGQYDDYLERALLDYKSGERDNAIMAGFAKSLSNEDIKKLARWYRSQEGKLNAPVISSIKIFKD